MSCCTNSEKLISYSFHTHIATRFEMWVLEMVVVLLNCLLIIFPYILELLELGIAGGFMP